MSHDLKIKKQCGSLEVNGPVSLAKGNVTQLTNLSTAVSCSNSTGVITTVSATTAAGASASFNVSNSNVTAASSVLLTINNYGGAGLPIARVSNVIDGRFTVVITNIHSADALNAALKIAYLVL